MDRFGQERLIESLAVNEMLIKELYAAYSKIFPAWSALWAQMAGEEASHAEWIRAVYRTGESVNIFVSDPERFDPNAIASFGTYIKERIAEAASTILPLDKALAIALDIENALIENRYFEAFTGDPVTLRQTFERLKAATETHRDKLVEALTELQRELP